MKAIILSAPETPPAAHADFPAPTPAGNEVLVRVHASSANPVDNAIAAGMLTGMVEHEFPVVLGRDYAGVVEQAGSDVTRYAAGDEVYGFLPAAEPMVHAGTWAELIAVPEDASIARKPDVDLAAAGAAPVAGGHRHDGHRRARAVRGRHRAAGRRDRRRRLLRRPARRGRRRDRHRAGAGRGRGVPARPGRQRTARPRRRRGRGGPRAPLGRRGRAAGPGLVHTRRVRFPCGLAEGRRPRRVAELGAAGDGPGRTNVMADPEPGEPGTPGPAPRGRDPHASPSRTPTSSTARARPFKSSPPPTPRASWPSASSDP